MTINQKSEGAMLVENHAARPDYDENLSHLLKAKDGPNGQETVF